MNDFKYFIVNKPFNVLSQFSEEGPKPTLKTVGAFPTDVYPVGRLDADSEGLLILTNDKNVTHKLMHPSMEKSKEYLVQVEGEITQEAIQKLITGVEIRIKGKTHQTSKAFVSKIDAPNLPERIPPIRVRQNIPTSWISITITEGKNRQIRRMTAAVGFPTLRLVRTRIQNLQLDFNDSVIEMNKEELYSLIGI